MRRALVILAAGLLVAGTVRAQVPLITTVAGGGSGGFCGDGGPATSACLRPSRVTVDALGNLFISDPENHRIRKVDTSGTITSVAGGRTLFCGDGGPATSACLYNPEGLAIDAVGNLFIADVDNNRIRKVSPAGIITTVAGVGPAFPDGSYCGDGGPASEACLNEPFDVAVDALGNLFIADGGNRRIRMVDAAGTITTVAGSGAYGSCGDGGPATMACLGYPWGVAVDAAGNLFIADIDTDRIRKVDTGGTITTVAGGRGGYCGDGGPAINACLSCPSDVAVDAAGEMFIADSCNNRVRKVDALGKIGTVAGTGSYDFCGDGGPATGACLASPRGVAVGAANSLLVADSDNSRVRQVAPPQDVLFTLTLAQALTAGCLKTTGKVTLVAAAPAGGLTVALHSDNPNVVVPASLTFKAGVLAKSFSILTSPVAVRETATIEARVPGQILSAVQAIKPIGAKSVTLMPNPVVGGNPVTGTVMLQCPAAPGPIVVYLASSTTSVAVPTMASLTVPVGTRTMPFEVTTAAVDRVRKPTISATANGVKKGKTLTVNP